MEDAEGVLSFDFERGLEIPAAANVLSNAEGQQAVSTVAAAALGQSSDPTTASAEGVRHAPGPRRSIRQTVCRHWLRGLCMKGDLCGFLHQLDRARMPICRFYARYGECREPDCVFKHTNEDIKECHMYMLGFCPNGPDCRYKHVKLPGPVPSIEETYQKIQQRMAMGYHGTQSNRYTTQRQGVSSLQGDPQVLPSLQVEAAAAANGTDIQNLQQVPPPPSSALPLQQAQGSQETQMIFPIQATPSLPVSMPSTQSPPFVSASTPLPEGYSRYFVVKSCNRENLDLSVMRGMWATHRNNEAKLNEAFDSCDNVILVFSVNETGHFQGCARMMSRIGVISGGGSWKYADGNARYGRNFLLKWLKLCELSFHKTRHLRNTYNENLPVKISRDCQELELSVGEQLASLLYMEPDSDLMKSANEAEAKREEETAKGSSSVKDLEGADISPYEDVDYKEEQSDEDDSSSPTTNLNKGDSKGMQPLGRGTLPPFGRGSSRGRERGLISNTYALGYENMAGNPADCFALPGTAVGRGFPHYYPLQSYGGKVFPSVRPRSALGFGPMDAALPSSGMAFPVRRPPNGPYWHKASGIMGPPALMVGARPMNILTTPKSQSVSVQGRPGRLPRSTQNTGSGGLGRSSAKDQQKKTRGVGLLKNTAKQVRPSPSVGGTPRFGGAEPKQGHKAVLARNSFSKEAPESSSEDEAPRRSRYGEGKKRRRDGQGDHIFAEDLDQRTPQGDQWGGTDQQIEVAY
eukprot:c11558_g1_i1 orf=390-2630(-)